MAFLKRDVKLKVRGVKKIKIKKPSRKSMKEQTKSIIAFIIFALAISSYMLWYGYQSDRLVENCKPNHELQICE